MYKTVWVVTCDEYPKQAFWHKKNADREVESGDEVCLAAHEATEVIIHDDEIILNDKQWKTFTKFMDKYKEPYPLYDCLQLMFTDEGLSETEWAEVAKVFIEWALAEEDEE